MNAAARKMTRSSSDEAAYVFESAEYCNSEFENMYNFQQSKMFCDVTVMVGREEYSAHRVVLAAGSPYFANVLHGEDRSSANRVVEIDLGARSPRSFQLILQYIYSGKITITTENIRDVIIASKILQIASLETAGCNGVSLLLSPANWFTLKTVAGAECPEEVYVKCRTYALEHFAEITDTEAFLRLSINEVKELVGDHEVSVISEEEKYSAVMKWVKHDLLERKENLFELMKAVQLLLMDNTFFMANVFTENLLRLDLECMTLVLDNTKYHVEMQCGSASSTRPDPHKHSKNQLLSYIFAIGGRDDDRWDSMSECEVYNSETNTWHAIASMQNERYRHAVIGLGQLLYAFGGSDSGKKLASAEYYDPRKDTWTFTTPLPHERYEHAICALNGTVIICGGEIETDLVLSTVEQFDVTTAQYKTCAAMNTKRTAFKTAAIGDCIYAVAGWNGASLNSVERFDPREGRWFPAPSMRTSRYWHGVTALNDCIYCTGGFETEKTGERFDIRKNAWGPIPEMLTARYGHELVTLGGCVYAVGGSGNSVEKFDPNTNRWLEMPSMLKERDWLGAYVLDCLEITHLLN